MKAIDLIVGEEYVYKHPGLPKSEVVTVIDTRGIFDASAAIAKWDFLPPSERQAMKRPNAKDTALVSGEGFDRVWVSPRYLEAVE